MAYPMLFLAYQGVTIGFDGFDDAGEFKDLRGVAVKFGLDPATLTINGMALDMHLETFASTNLRGLLQRIGLMHGDKGSTAENPIPLGGRAAGASTTPTVPGASLSKPLIVTLAKGQSRHSVEFEETPEWSVLQQTVEDTFPEHMVEEYKLKIGKHLLTQRNWKTLSAEQSKDCSVTVAVISLAKPFSSFKEIEAYKHLALNLKSAHPNEDAFPTQDIDLQKKLDDHIIEATGLNTQGELLEHVGRELALRCLYTHPADHKKESGKRELIGPVLFGVAALAGDVEVIAELNVSGKLGKGSVDYVIMYRSFCIVVAEGKLHDMLEEHFGQLAAEMRAAREQFIFKRLGKRKLDEGDVDFDKVPSFGILTNGTNYLLYKYDPAARFDDERLLTCSSVPVLMKRGMDAKSAAAEAMNIIKRLLPIVQQQKEGMINFCQCREEKKQKLSP